MTTVAVVDYLGNLGSVSRALEWLGAVPEVTDSPEKIMSASHVILPGDGAFAYGMSQLRDEELVDPILEFIRSGRPFLGICVGMQLLLSESEEFGLHEGLGVIPGRVVPFPQGGAGPRGYKIPHIGWSFLHLPGEERDDGDRPAANWDGTILADVRPGDSVYFVHSFLAMPAQASDNLADTEYGGQSVCAVVARANVTGCQFHPEKSGPVGLRILKRFVELRSSA